MDHKRVEARGSNTHRAHGALRVLRGYRKGVVLLVGALAPTAALAWIGCSTKSAESFGAHPNVDPGGTFGAELGVRVIGRGRVTASVPGIDCPSRCFSSYVFGDRTQPAAAGGVTLKAIPTPGVRFDGWQFESIPVASRGRGPEVCNPISREGAKPSVDLQSLEVTLPYAEVNGAPPAGQEAQCAASTAVPAAYRVTATFTETVIDSGPDGRPDGGVEVFVEAPFPNTAGREIGVVSGRVYWRFEQQNGLSGIATVSTSGGAAQVVAGTSDQYRAFEIGTHVVWQTTGGTMGIIQAGNTNAQTFSAGGRSCVAVESELSSVYCRTAGPGGTIASWTTAGTSATTLYSGLPIGDEIAVDANGFYITDDTNGGFSTTIKGIARGATPDGGVPTMTELVTGLSNPTGLELGFSRLYWIDYDGAGSARSAPRTGGTAFTSAPATFGLKYLSVDPNGSSTFFVGIAPSTSVGESSIVRLSTSSTTSTPVRQGLTGLGGIAVDGSYVYWTQSDGRVYRAPR